ncbi:hypothetical protein MTQ10_13100 [Streptomyces sp. XM83C]|jgi:predicted MFS family arabinose efflux permease|uniref:MFS transporter n=1 Tax=Streptomyces thermocoprophilus TaxID=78356 RepID=A0ABV5V879_9ACTN|nr:hypothetical protein [Streptomyces sp. XM83C]MCK1820527.1 hypothetical protein [Streptomyces sp. XM83C]
MVAENRKAGAVAPMSGGPAAADVLGVPLGTFPGRRSTLRTVPVRGAAFDVGGALGAWLGGPTVDSGHGGVTALWAGDGLALAGVVVAAGSLGAGAARSRPAPTGADHRADRAAA